MSLGSWIFNIPFTAQDHLKMMSVRQGGEMIEIHINHKQCVVFWSVTNGKSHHAQQSMGQDSSVGSPSKQKA